MIQELSDRQLEEELQRRKEIKSEKERQDRMKMIALVLENRDVLKKFMRHCRSSCECGVRNNGYYHPENGSATCNTCCLERLGSYDDDIDIIVDIRLIKRS